MKKISAIPLTLFFIVVASVASAQSVSDSENILLFLNQELSSGLSTSDHINNIYVGANFSSRVVESTKKGEFIYWFKVKNIGTTEIIVQWELIDRAISGRFNFMHLIRLKPNETKEFKLETDAIPTAANGRVRVFQESNTDFFKSLRNQGDSVSVSKEDGMWHMMGSSMEGYIPRDWLKKFSE